MVAHGRSQEGGPRAKGKPQGCPPHAVSRFKTAHSASESPHNCSSPSHSLRERRSQGRQGQGLTQGHPANPGLGDRFPAPRPDARSLTPQGSGAVGAGSWPCPGTGLRRGPGGVGLPFAERPAEVRSPPAAPSPSAEQLPQPEEISAPPEDPAGWWVRTAVAARRRSPGDWGPPRPNARECPPGPPRRVGPLGPATRAAAPG